VEDVVDSVAELRVVLEDDREEVVEPVEDV